MHFRKFLKKIATWHKKGQNTFDSVSVSRQLSISTDHAYRDLWRLWRMGFLNRKKVKRKHHYYISKKGWGYLKYMRTYEPNFHVSSLEACNRIKELLSQQRRIFSGVSDDLKTFSLCCPDEFNSYGLIKYFENISVREKFNELNEKILKELDFVFDISLFHAKKQLRKNTKRYS